MPADRIAIHDSADMNVAFAEFRRAYPTFDTTCALDDLRTREYARLDAQGHEGVS